MLFYGLFLALSLGKVSFAEDRLDDSVRRLSSQITRIFDEQARFDLIEKGLSEHIQGKIATRQQNLEEISANSQAKFQKFVNLKIKAVKKLVETAEKVTEEYVYDQKWIHDAVVSKFRSNPPPGQDPTKFERECREYSSKIAKKNVFNVTKDEDFRKTAVHINVESYQCDNAVLRDFEWTGSEMMEQQFRENQETDPSIIRQYIGTNSGLTRMLPAIKWIAEPVEVTMDLFDPRYRPWFTAAESAPKDAIFLIDYSGSVKGQTLHLMKITIQFVLTTLTTNDYFSAIWYNSRTGYILDECCGQDFLPATTKNKRLLLTQLDKIEERDVANLAQALNETFDRFERSLEVSEKFKKTLGDAGKSGGHKIVLLFTDGIENWPNLVIDEYKNEFPDEIIRVFGFSMGYGTGEMPALNYTTCETRGSYAIVDSIMDVRLQCKSYILKLSEILALVYKEKPVDERPLTWSVPYMDAQRGGAMITVSAPIVNVMENSTGGFSAVAGVDVSFSQIREMLPTSDHLYAFLMDNNGILFFHPKLRIPKRETYAVRRTACYNVKVLHRHGTRVPYGVTDERVQRMLGLVDSIATTDILEIEKPTAKMVAFRKQMIDKNCGKNVEDGGRIYRCRVVDGTPFVIGFIYDKRYAELSLIQEDPTNPPKLTYVPKELVGYLISDRTLCPDELGAHGPLERFEPFIFGDYPSCPKPKNQHLPFAFIRGIQTWDKSWPELEENSTCLTNPLPFNLFPKYFISTFVQFYQGITVLYPKCASEHVRDFTNNPTHFLSLQPDVSNKLYVEHEPLSGSITVTKPIFDTKNGYRIASAGIQWTYSFLADLWFNVTRDDPGWKECLVSGKKCLLVSNEAFVLGSSSGGFGQHMSDLEPELLAALMGSGVVKKQVFRDYQSDCPMEKRGIQILSGANSPRPANVQKLFAKVVSYFFSVAAVDLTYFVESVFSRPVYVDGNCRYETPENTEQCTMEFNRYSFVNKNNEKLLVHLSAQSGCPGTVTIYPFAGIDMSLLVFDGTCFEKPQQLPYGPVRIPDCNQTRQFYRKLRPDLDYSRFHVFETVRKCISINSATILSTQSFIFSVIFALFSRVISNCA